jgi:hypothetical protein
MPPNRKNTDYSTDHYNSIFLITFAPQLPQLKSKYGHSLSCGLNFAVSEIIPRAP